MSKDINKALLTKVLESIPEHISTVTYLMDFLELSQGSVYRRLKGEIPFSFDEVYRLSLNLGFSVDEIFDLERKNRIFFDTRNDIPFNPSNAFMATLENLYSDIEFLSANKDSVSIHAQNRVPLILALFYDDLFRFFYYKWTHQLDNAPLNYRFSDVVFPPGIVALRNKILSRTGRVSTHTFILNKEVYLNIIKEIQYYYKRKLISEEELKLLRSDLIRIIRDTEEFSYKGVDRFNDAIFIYLSSFNIESNSIYISSGGHSMSYFYPYTANPMIIRNAELCSVHRQWLESLKKYSILITQSNEELMAEFFSHQFEYVDNMDRLMY
jgi:hypothetical protein